jgi:ribosomal peptide maturation radical SAM protein 1
MLHLVPHITVPTLRPDKQHRHCRSGSPNTLLHLKSPMRVALVNPPFASYRRPSIALAQLRTCVQARLPHACVHIHNINLDCVPILGTGPYTEISDGYQSWTGLGDWLFRPAAFPDAADNREGYFHWLGSSDVSAGDVKTTDSTWQRTFGDSALAVSWQHELCCALPDFLSKRGLYDYDVVGVTSMFSQNVAALAILRLIKKHNPLTVCVMGGANCGSPMGEALAQQFSYLDAVFVGRSHEAFPEFLAAFARTGALTQIPPIDGVVNHQSALKRPPNADQTSAKSASAPRRRDSGAKRHALQYIPVDYDDFVKEVRSLPFPCDITLPFETSVGCWWGEVSHCTFCGLNSDHMRFLSLTPKDAVQLIQSLIDKYQDVCRSFEATDNILDYRYFDSVLPLLRVPSHVSLFYEIKANLTDKHIRTLARANVRRIQPGIEALSSHSLRLLKKGTTGVRNAALLKDCSSYGIYADWNLLINIPEETIDTYRYYLATLPSLFHLEPPAGAFDIRYDRFSPYFVERDQYQLTLAPFRFYSFIYPLDEKFLWEVAYVFEDTAARSKRPGVLRHYQESLCALISRWQAAWKADARPRLEFSGPSMDVILDTRPCAVNCQHALTTEERLALRFLEQPRQLDNLYKMFVEQSLEEASVNKTLCSLRHKRLIFEDELYAVSIVVNRHLDAA